MNPWNVGGVTMRYPIMIGGGVCKTPESVTPYLHPDLPLGPPEVGSFTPTEAAGNTEAPQEYWIESLSSGLNAWGMPNCGREKAIEKLDSMGLQESSIIVNIAAFTPDGYAESYAAFAKKPYVAAVTGNLSCPNKHAERKIPISLDLDSLEQVFAAMSAVKAKTPFWAKIAPAFYPEDLIVLRGHGLIVDAVPTVGIDYMEKFVELVEEYSYVVNAIVATNTGPNFSYHIDGKPVTRPNGGLAGLSGKLLRPYARRTAKDILSRTSPFMDVIAAGGISTGDEVIESLEDGCSAVQVTSLPHFANNGPHAITSLVHSERLQQTFINH